MFFFKHLLYPLAFIFFVITSLKNFLFEINFLKSKKFDLPLIGIGNLSFGGTGKTPMSEFIIENLNQKFNLAFLSRGYKRTTKGFVLATNHSKVEIIGDEPFQIFKKFKNIKVAVDENRANGIKNLIQMFPGLDAVVLDDVFQHRSINLKLNILLTTYDKPFFKDYLAPIGTLRESTKGMQRANIIVITKCPYNMEDEKKELIIKKLSLKSNQDVFFSSVSYDEVLYGKDKRNISQLENRKVLLITGIADTNSIVEYLNLKKIDFIHISFEDHHVYNQSDYLKISRKFENYSIITTEKDFYKISDLSLKNDIYYLKIKTKFLQSETKFIQKIEKAITN